MPDEPRKYNKDGSVFLNSPDAKKLKKDFAEVSTDFGKSLTKAIKKANISGASHFRMEFFKAADASQKAVVKNFRDLQSAGFGDIAKAYTEALQGAQQGLISATEFESIGKKFIDSISEKFPDLAQDFAEDMETAVGSLQLDKMQKDMGDAIKESVKGAFDMIPRNAFTKALGLDFAMDTLSNAIGEAAGTGLGEFVKDANWKKMLPMAIGAAVVIGITTAIIKGVSALTDEVGKAFGAIGVLAFAPQLQAAKADVMEIGFGMEEVVSSATILSEKFGISFGEAIGISKSTIATARALGLSVDNAAELTGMLMVMGGHTAQSAQDFMKQTQLLAHAAGVAPGAVLKDMAENSEAIAMFTKDGGKNMQKAAVQAKAMGMSIGDTAKMAEGLLNFEDSISKELTASILLGRRINLQEARRLALHGEMEEATKSMLEQVGSEAEFNNLLLPQRQALADALNTDLVNLKKMVHFQSLSAEEQEKITKHAMSMKDLIPKEAISLITELGYQFKAIGAHIIAAFAGIVSFGGFITAESPGWAKALSGVIAVVLAIGLVAGGAWLGFKLLGLAMGGMVPVLGSFAAVGWTALVPLLAIAAIGGTIALILMQFPPIINSITNMFEKLNFAEALVGLVSIGLGLWGLSAALASVAMVGYGALPIIAAVSGLAALGLGLGTFFGAKAADKGKSAEVTQLETLNGKIDTLIEKFEKSFIPELKQSNKEIAPAFGKQLQKNAYNE